MIDEINKLFDMTHDVTLIYPKWLRYNITMGLYVHHKNGYNAITLPTRMNYKKHQLMREMYEHNIKFYVFHGSFSCTGYSDMDDAKLTVLSNSIYYYDGNKWHKPSGIDFSNVIDQEDKEKIYKLMLTI